MSSHGRQKKRECRLNLPDLPCKISNEPPEFSPRSSWDLVPLSTLLEGLVLLGRQGTPINAPSPHFPPACARLHYEDRMLTPLVPDLKEAPLRPNQLVEHPRSPPLLVPPPNIPISRPPLSPGAKSLGALSTSSGMTPEKERLMKALQQRKKQMAKRAEATKKKQSIEEDQEAEIDNVNPNEENKENINLVPGREAQGLETARDDQEENPVELTVPPLEPEPQSEPQEEEMLSAAVFRPEAPAMVDFEGRRSAFHNDPSADNTFPVEHGETTLDTVQSQTLQTVSEDETRAENTDSAIPGQNETKGDLVPPSANLEDPLDKESTETSSPNLELQNTSPSHQPIVPLMENESLDAPIVVTGPAEAPESTPRLDTSPAGVPLNTEIEQSVTPVFVSIDPVPTVEALPEAPSVEKTNPIPLDQRRKVHLEPIQVHTPEHSEDDDNLSDDSFMEELRSATVQEARPVSVKTPRSVSSSYTENGPPTPLLVAKKVNVSSGISSRIKALEKFQSREGTPPSGNHTVTGPSASSSFDSLRKRASVSYGSPESYSRAPSLNRQDSHSSPNVRRTSISVTARIVRENGASPGSNGVEPTETDVLGLQASPLTVQHGSSQEPLPSSEPAESIPQSEDRSTSISSAGSNMRPSSASRPVGRPSLSSRPKTDDNLHATSPTTEEKKASRASRIMRRMSSMTTTSRRSIIGALSPPAKEQDISPMNTRTVSASSSRTHVSEPIDIGEVNVQFPDTLLWKRRFMRIDENGYVVLTPATNDASARNMTKRYHLTEFRTPCLPDEDMQELPNSILLDFSDGSTLQCACETRQGQSSALQTLIDAHSAHQQ
ncbi:uncharacterized protein N7477_003655 [Penicillium maclennaniae]|uniref:uncharacterized protein n=1 Tax=Penicillium maclennaniae TaxID=1343394 RepID=UPI0025402566|nr:uncharacterized protein N7477_003655 [Penicillium maclennaniae]KAJ5678022.1 hypothetical protein N7477_003655 [Penicillium maclennaniae]